MRRHIGDSATLKYSSQVAAFMEADKTMFEIYRDTTYTGKYRVVYYTELTEANKEYEINKAMAGEHFYDGFVRNFRKDEAKEIIETLLKRMNEGEKLGPDDIEAALGEHSAAR
jgi:hypothetical protein